MIKISQSAFVDKIVDKFDVTRTAPKPSSVAPKRRHGWIRGNLGWMCRTGSGGDVNVADR